MNSFYLCCRYINNEWKIGQVSNHTKFLDHIKVDFQISSNTLNIAIAKFWLLLIKANKTDRNFIWVTHHIKNSFSRREILRKLTGEQRAYCRQLSKLSLEAVRELIHKPSSTSFDIKKALAFVNQGIMPGHIRRAFLARSPAGIVVRNGTLVNGYKYTVEEQNTFRALLDEYNKHVKDLHARGEDLLTWNTWKALYKEGA